MMNSRSQGFTLVELLVVILIGTVVLGAVYQTLASQERSNRQQTAFVIVEQANRMGLGVITNDLREVSAVGGDVYAADSVSIQFRAYRKAGVTCTKDYGSNGWLDVLTIGSTFTAGDSIAVFTEGANKASALDDGWGIGGVTSVGTGNCTGYPAFGTQQRVNTSSAIVSVADSGALVRSYEIIGFRLANYSTTGGGILYRMKYPASTSSPTDSVPIVEDLANISEGGLRLRYFNLAGTEINPNTAALRATIMRIQVKVTGRYTGGASSSALRMLKDSLVGQVFLRGNEKTS
jgi:prepilin-type N-terminal cleavage/methylation domain-containing protein